MTSCTRSNERKNFKVYLEAAYITSINFKQSYHEIELFFNAR